MSSPVVLIFGAGANVGLSLARKFKQEGYKVAAVSRTIKDDLKKVADKTIASSVTPERVTKIFEEVQKDLGPPNVVIYNGTISFMRVALFQLTYPQPTPPTLGVGRTLSVLTRSTSPKI